ncbi:MAG: hypothetical protein ACYTEN_01610 [Planctomycetota bacterium]
MAAAARFVTSPLGSVVAPVMSAKAQELSINPKNLRFIASLNTKTTLYPCLLFEKTRALNPPIKLPPNKADGFAQLFKDTANVFCHHTMLSYPWFCCRIFSIYKRTIKMDFNIIITKNQLKKTHFGTAKEHRTSFVVLKLFFIAKTWFYDCIFGIYYANGLYDKTKKKMRIWLFLLFCRGVHGDRIMNNGIE